MLFTHLKEFLVARQHMDPRELEFLSLKHAHERGIVWFAIHATQTLLVIGLVVVVIFNVFRVILR